MNEFAGSWVRKGGVLVPVPPVERKKLCKVCGNPSPVGLCRPCKESTLHRVHGSHAGFNQHKRRNELPCLACSDAEKVYQNRRYKRGSLSAVDREWAERTAVKWSWVFDARTNRM